MAEEISLPRNKLDDYLSEFGRSDEEVGIIDRYPKTDIFFLALEDGSEYVILPGMKITIEYDTSSTVINITPEE